MAQSLCQDFAAADGGSNVTLFCPCLDRRSTRFSLLTHFRPLSSTTGALLHASVRQAARDRGYQLSAYEYDPDNGLNVRQAAEFLDDEIRAGTAGIVVSLDSSQLIGSLSAANAAGVPIYLVGGSDPRLVLTLQKLESALGGPLRASVRYIGPDESTLASSLAATLMARGVNHVECVVFDVGDARWPSRCRMVQKAFMDAGMSVGVLPVLNKVDAAVRDMLERLPGIHVAMFVEDAATYGAVKASLPSGANVSVVVYETSVGILEDVRAGKNVVAVDLGTYTQGYLALALASVEHHTGQMVTSDVEIEFTIHGGGAQPVTDAIMGREVCRAAGNPVCGDPGVLPVTSSGCACFDRAEVRYKVIGAVPKRFLSSYYLYQGMADAQRDFPGSTFQWNAYEDVELVAQLAEYAEVVNGSFYRGVISFDAILADTSDVLLGAIRSVSESGKPLYLGFLQAPAASIPLFLDRFKARLFVGPNHLGSGRNIAELARQLQGRHVLILNNYSFLAVIWEWMRTILATHLGPGYAFPPNIFDFPQTDHGSPSNGTGAWALFADPAANHTAQIVNGAHLYLGAAFVKPLHDKIVAEPNGPALTDILVMIAYSTFSSTVTLPMLANVTREQPGRPPVRLITYKCTDVEYSALLRANLTENEQLVLGCVDEQMYLSSYLLATAAALEQQTGEHVVGEVRTERLLRYDQLPLHYARRVACERSNHENGFSKGQLGVFYPLCDVRDGCIEEGMSNPSTTTACSGHGTCQFPKQPPAAGTTYGSQGACVCQDGWTGRFCSERLVPWAHRGGRHWWLILLGILVPLGILVVGLFILVRVAHRGSVAAASNERVEGLLQRHLSLGGDDATQFMVVVMDVDGLTALLAWDANTTNEALEVLEQVIHSLLPHFYGLQVDAAPGAYTLIFHDPVNALRFASALQCGLLFPRLVEARMRGRLASMFRSRRALCRGDGPPDWPPSLLKHNLGAEVKCPLNHARLYRGLRVRVGMHVGVADKRHNSLSSRQLAAGEHVDLAAAICNIASGGQVLLSMAAWRSLGSHVSGTVCHHMGMHEVANGLPPIHLMQAVPESLVKRAPFPPIQSLRQLGPSFFDAPAVECYVNGQAPTETVVIEFLYVASAKSLRKTPGFKEGVDLLVAFVQGRLAEFEAYEVEEKDGNFLLAFRSAARAILFAETIQRQAMELPWSKKLLQQDLAAEVIKPALPDGQGGMTKEMVVFRGLRLKIGMCMGVPSDCQPHMATGRAAYFGPLVNRAARIAATAAPGQTLVNHECYASAKGECGSVLFTEMGQFKLKGVKEPMHLYQVSSHELSVRLFRRTLRLASLKHANATPSTALEPAFPCVSDDGEGSLVGDDSKHSSAYMFVTITPGGQTVRKGAALQGIAGQAEPTLGGARQRGDVRGCKPSLPGGGRTETFSDDDKTPTSAQTAGSVVSIDEGSWLRQWSSEESARSRGRLVDFSEDDAIEDDAIYDLSFDQLVELAVEQHGKIKALKRSLGRTAEC